MSYSFVLGHSHQFIVQTKGLISACSNNHLRGPNLLKVIISISTICLKMRLCFEFFAKFIPRLSCKALEQSLCSSPISCWALSVCSYTKSLKPMRPLINFLRRVKHYTWWSTVYFKIFNSEP